MASRILIVDADDRNGQLLTIMLGREGLDIFTARSGEEAMTLIAADPPDLILLDAKLPGMTGYQVAAILKGDVATRNIPIVMLTTLDTLEDRIRGLKAYGDHFYQYSRRLEGEVASRTAALVERTKALEERSRDLARALDRAEKAGHAKEALLGRVSHELRTPLNAMVGWADVIEKDHSPALLRRALPAIKRNGLAQERVIENLLDASSIDAGLLRLDPQAVDLRSIVTSAIDIVRPAAEARTLSIASTCEGAVMVLGDPARLRQVVWHLLSNAVKFTPEGGAVRVHLECAGRTVRLEVSDDGIGMAPEYLPQAFSGFSQADMSSTRQYTGLGLGLTIVRRLVEMQGGTVTAFSAGDNQGATFVVELPKYEPESGGHCTAGIPVVPARRETAPLAGVRVLVVDDNAESRQAIATRATSSRRIRKGPGTHGSRPFVYCRCCWATTTRDGRDGAEPPRRRGRRRRATSLRARERLSDRYRR